MTDYGNRGMSLENLINAANAEYEKNGTALIQKIATPVKVIRGFDGNNKYRVQAAFHEQKSTVDFRGTLTDGRSIAVEAKSTLNKTQFRFDNVKPHQMEFLRGHARLGGISLIIVEFKEIGETYRISVPDAFDYLQSLSAQKNVKISEIRKICHKCTAEGENPLHYLRNLIAEG